MKRAEIIYCHFCGCPADMARALVTLVGVSICDECIELCRGVIRARLREEEWERLKDFGP